MTLSDAAIALARMRLARHYSGQSSTVEQMECQLCEDGVSAMLYAFFQGDPAPLAICFDAPQPFDAERCVNVLARQSVTVH